MNTRLRRGVTGAAALVVTTGLTAVPATVASAWTDHAVPTITARVTSKAVHLSSGHSVQAGRVRFRVLTPKGDHSLQLVKLKPGYSPQEFGRDVNLAFQGKIPAIRRIDHRVHWAGGAETRPHKPGMFAKTLYPGTYYLFDQNSNARTKLRVHGQPEARAWIPNSSTIVGTGADRFRSPKNLPHRGWTLFKDTADEPHFLVMQQVKRGTTRKDVHDFIASGAQGEPPWVRPAETSSGVISQHSQMEFHYSLPRGRYVLICFWPSVETGMPHAFMGMYRLVNLR